MKLRANENVHITSSGVKPAFAAASPPSMRASCRDQMHQMQYKLKSTEINRFKISGVVHVEVKMKTKRLKARDTSLNIY